MILSHGRTEVFLHYATVIGDHQRVAEHWVLEEEWEKVIEVLGGQVSLDFKPGSLTLTQSQSDLNLYYTYAPVLLKQTPKSTVDAWIKQPALDALRLIPALLQLQHIPRDPILPNQAIRYLTYQIFELHNTASTIHNLLITFHVSPSSKSADYDERPLLRFLSTVPKDMITGKPYYDLDYALRICKEAGRRGACVQLYAEMGLWEEAVDLALGGGDADLEIARGLADRAEEEDVRLRKKLLLKIAKFVVQNKKDIKSSADSFIFSYLLTNVLTIQGYGLY